MQEGGRGGGLEAPREREESIRDTHPHLLTCLHPPSHPFTHLTNLNPPSARANRSIMQQAVGMAMTDRARAATSRILSCTSLSRHGEKKKETQRRNILGPSCPRPQVSLVRDMVRGKRRGNNRSHQENTHTLTHAHRQRGGGMAELRLKDCPLFSLGWLGIRGWRSGGS